MDSLGFADLRTNQNGLLSCADLDVLYDSSVGSPDLSNGYLFELASGVRP